MKAQLVGEDEHHYVMHDGQSEFRVPKAGLRPETHDKIRSMARKMADGGAVEGEERERILARLNSPTLPLGYFRDSEGVHPLTPMRDDTPPPQVQAPGLSESIARSVGHALAPGLVDAPAPTVVPTAPVATANPGMTQTAPAQPPSAAPSAPPPAAPMPPAAAPSVPVRPAARAPAAAPKPPTEPDWAKGEREALAQQRDIDAQKGRQLADISAGVADQLQANQIKAEQQSARARAAADADMREIQAKREAIANLDGSIDSNHFWASRSTPQKIGAIIGLALGAIGTGPDGVNRAAAMLQHQVDADIDAQKTEHEYALKKGKEGLESAQAVYAQHRQQGLDDAQATAAAQATGLAIAKAKVDAAIAATAEPQAKQQYAMLSAELGQKIAATNAAQAQQLHANRLAEMKAADEHAKTVAEVGKLNAEAAEKGGVSQEISPGWVTSAHIKIEPGEEKELRDNLAARDQLRAQVSDYKERVRAAVKASKTGSIGGKDANELEAQRASMIETLKKVNQFKSITPLDAKLFEAQVPEVTGLGNAAKDVAAKQGVPGFRSFEDKLAGMDAFLADADSKVERELAAKGVHRSGGGSRMDSEAVAWARANPNDPRAAAVLRKAGVQ